MRIAVKSALATLGLALGVACIDGTTTKSDYDLGCEDGYDFGYSAGLSHGESCGTYDDDPGERFDTAQPDYDQGYVDCYPDGYADGYSSGSTGSGC
ncbi:MAG: hypothetical protein H6739_10640 [Alphaproteobacteria bacterium]|nr:hypothetical protein [Alphaproteobacteria bacterium]